MLRTILAMMMTLFLLAPGVYAGAAPPDSLEITDAPFAGNPAEHGRGGLPGIATPFSPDLASGLAAMAGPNSAPDASVTDLPVNDFCIHTWFSRTGFVNNSCGT